MGNLDFFYKKSVFIAITPGFCMSTKQLSYHSPGQLA